MSKIIDVLGQPCPIPVIKAKQALNNDDIIEVFVLVDNIVAVQNLEKMANGMGYIFSYDQQEEKFYQVKIKKSNIFLSNKITETSENIKIEKKEKKNDFIVVISQDKMGNGSDELGKILIKGFIFSLSELEQVPTHMLFLNAGAFLTSLDSNTIDDLKVLETKGTEILTCGTCANYFQLEKKLAVGRITDMYGITKIMTEAGKVIHI